MTDSYVSPHIAPFKQRNALVSWLRLPFMLLRIRTQRPADAAEVLRYFKTKRLPYLRTRPMRIVLAALRRQAQMEPNRHSPA